MTNEILSLTIFNRWGAVVFSADNFSPGAPEGRWDGRFNLKVPDPAIFVYLAKIKFIDGHEKLFSGDVLIGK